MRTSLFLSALFAVSLVGGIASAEKPNNQEHRKRSDIVDRSYAHSSTSKPRELTRDAQRSNPSQLKSPGENRWNCSDAADCSARRASHDRVVVKRAEKDPASKKVNRQGEERMNCPVDGAECRGVKSTHGGDRATGRSNKGTSRTAPAQLAQDSARASVAADRAKGDKAVAKPRTYKEKQEAERMKGMLKHAVCKKTGADC
jgi:hypothetical protein